MDEDQNGGAQPQGQTDELDNAKRQAVEALSPLLADLNMDPQRKFDLSLSSIRVTDDRSLIPVALNAAMAIEDKNAKAEALVKVINEINYLQQANQPSAN